MYQASRPARTVRISISIHVVSALNCKLLIATITLHGFIATVHKLLSAPVSRFWQIRRSVLPMRD